MYENILPVLEASRPAAMLRGSLWLYPAVNTGHILGIALLVGSIIPMDLKLLGAWPSVSPAPLFRILSATAAAGIALTLICGLLLFITRATGYAGSSVFVSKMALVGVGMLNGLVMRRIVSSPQLPRWLTENSAAPMPVRLGACLSLFCWLTALVLGRFIGYVN